MAFSLDCLVIRVANICANYNNLVLDRPNSATPDGETKRSLPTEENAKQVSSDEPNRILAKEGELAHDSSVDILGLCRDIPKRSRSYL